VLLVESERMIKGRPWHKERLFFLISSARHFVAVLEAKGFKVCISKPSQLLQGLKKLKQSMASCRFLRGAFFTQAVCPAKEAGCAVCS
jgi:deoxyribodipyrimidine photolyase-related protein